MADEIKTPKANISLFNLCDFKNCGIMLSLKKAAAELSCLAHKSTKKTKMQMNIQSQKTYNDMISVIICTNRDESFAQTAALSLADNDFCDKYEIIIVNNKETPFKPLPMPKNTRIINEATPGISHARNKGANAAKGEYLLFIDDDAVAKPRLLKNMYTAFNRHKKYGVIGGQIFLKLPNDIPPIFLKGRESLWSAYTVPYKHFKMVTKQYELPYGACFGVNHRALDMCGGFPTDFGRCGNDYNGGEETALSLIIKKSGYKIGVLPKAAVTHIPTENRFTKEHVERTINAGIVNTYKLSCLGYLDYIWTKEYIDTRIKILEKECERLAKGTKNPQKKQDKNKIIFYKQCEIKAFNRVLNMINENLPIT